ncbi:hypothetical protein ACFW1M_01835 [Streptomyces inhibens]|uniref:hypothetical protein n=1 Tax=Streptomyces inhibens TaxID=2293571 RepID=UPI003676401B
MTALNPYESLWLDVLAELRNSPAIHVYNEFEEPVDATLGDAHTAAAEIAEDYELNLGPSLGECYLRFTGLGSSWQTVEQYPHVAGEFYIANLQRQLEEVPPELGWTQPSAADLQLLSELRTIDGTPDSGVGALAAVRIQPGVDSPEIWFDHGPRGAWKMDIDYRGYLEVLRVTKGTFGWQYLFTDVRLRGDDFGATGKRLENMLTVFPEIFPDHDYKPLRRRLAERLR